ncbi:3-keto-steroid reductase/17-beta-hydroxysteroid dehydrogenase 7-like [Tubulanus polymorphus]|uniref:3-keto-steroid reductase/17-beta-hydroxysteroid dehydrogenase 7-like n=1 Tax=Tubulanus polymorphus TaxID=672921 RepID=UPI003DA2851F
MKMSSKVAVITGGNAGLGLALAERLLTDDPTIRLCLACRNTGRAEAARNALKLSNPNARVDILNLDVGKLSSVYSAAKEITHRYDHVDYLYLNAGVLPGVKIRWEGLKEIFSRNVVHVLSTGDGLLTTVKQTTEDGLQEVFATNLFGHFVLVRQLEDFLARGPRTCQIIWSSSMNASKNNFHLDDIQHEKGFQAYSSSKYAIDLTSLAINNRLCHQNVYSHTTSPGFVLTKLTSPIVPNWLWYIILPILSLLRLFVPSMTIYPYNGAESMFWLSKQRPETLNPCVKYCSGTSLGGTNQVTAKNMNLDEELAIKLFQKLCELEKSLRSNYT